MTISRISCRTWAVAILVLFAAAGAAVVGDYGLTVDANSQRRIAAANLEYVLGGDDALSAHNLPRAHDRYYGVAFDLPLLLAERALGLDDSRTVYLFRHSATHLFWLCGGFACFLLARRLFGGGPLALLAMLLFLLHPRLYAHAFFNSKDVPFLSMFMIALCLVHRAFEKDTVRAFAVLGAAAAALTNLRIMGVMLVAAVLGMRACDLLLAASGLRLLARRDAAWVRRGTYAAAAVAVAGIAIAMARIHPLQHAYFNFLVDRTTPEHLRTQYDMNYWDTTGFSALRHLAQTYPSTNLCVTGARHNRWLLSEMQKERIRSVRACRGRHADFVVVAHPLHPRKPEAHAPEVRVRKVYGNTIANVYGVNPALLDNSRVGLHLDRFRETHRSLTQGAPAARAHYDVYFDAPRGALTYARAPCVRTDMAARFFLHVVPVDADDLPDDQVRHGFDHLDFDLPDQALFDGKCLVTMRFPEWAVDHVRTGQTEKHGDVWTSLWEATIRF